MPGSRNRIERVQLVRYVAPGRALARPHGLVVRLRATGPAGEVTGVGEAVVAGDQTEPAWAELPRVAARVLGAALPDRVDPADPLRGFPGWRPVRLVDPGARRAATLAVEMALLDLLSVAVGQFWSPGADPAAPLGRQPEHPLPAAPPGSPPDQLSAALRADPGDAWAVRLRLTGESESELDLTWFRQVALLEREAGRNRPIWLVGGDRSPAGARGFVRELARLLPDHEPAVEVLLEDPVAAGGGGSRPGKLRQRTRWARRPPLGELQAVADQVLGWTGSGPRRLSIMASEDLGSVAQVRRQARSVGAVHLRLERFGTLTGLRAAARAARRAYPDLQVVVGADRGSRITGAALAALAAATPEIDRYVFPPGPGWPELGPELPAGRPAPGLIGGLDLGALAVVADELAELPPASAPPTADRPNRFPDYPLHGTALAVRSMLLETEALRLGLRTRRLARDFFLVEQPGSGTVTGFADSESSATSVAASAAAADKGVTRALLERAGLPVPPGAAFPATNRDGAHRAGLALGFPLVVKPAGGSKGTAVTTGIDSPAELTRALDEVLGSKYADSGIVVERFVTGHDYRVLATREEVLSVVRREPASVVGDGRRTVAELVLAANVLRRGNPHLGKRPIRLGQRADDQLRRQELTRHSVPAAGQLVRLRAEANLSLGGDSREVLDTVHPSLCELATAAVTAIPGLPYAGLDLLLEDHRHPVSEQPVSIIEVNSRPVQSLHHFPMFGPPRNVSARLVALTVRDAGWQPGPPVRDLTVRAAVTGRVAGTGYARWLARMATQLGLSGWVEPGGPDRVAVLAAGPASRVGLLLRLAFHGPADAGVVEVCTEPVDTVPPAGFTVRAGSRR